jgi:hypothetical protein
MPKLGMRGNLPTNLSAVSRLGKTLVAVPLRGPHVGGISGTALVVDLCSKP